MPYDRQSLYLTWGGKIGTAAGALETWQTGVHLTNFETVGAPPMPDHDHLQALLDGALSTFHSSGIISLSAGASLAWAKCALLATSGDYVPVTPITATRTPIAGGAGSTSAASPQDSMCITLWSGSNFGRANYGRLFMPWWSALVGVAEGRVNTAGMEIPVGDLINGIESWAVAIEGGSALRITIMSKLGAGSSKVPLYYRLGDVKDTQRRRRAQIRENYIQVAVGS